MQDTAEQIPVGGSVDTSGVDVAAEDATVAKKVAVARSVAGRCRVGMLVGATPVKRVLAVSFAVVAALVLVLATRGVRGSVVVGSVGASDVGTSVASGCIRTIGRLPPGSLDDPAPPTTEGWENELGLGAMSWLLAAMFPVGVSAQ